MDTAEELITLYVANRDTANNVALDLIANVELPIFSIFNTMSYRQFKNLLNHKISRFTKRQNFQTRSTLIVALVDACTCILKYNYFYDERLAIHCKSLLHRIYTLLSALQKRKKSISKVSDGQFDALLKLIARFKDRVDDVNYKGKISFLVENLRERWLEKRNVKKKAKLKKERIHPKRNSNGEAKEIKLPLRTVHDNDNKKTTAKPNKRKGESGRIDTENRAIKKRKIQRKVTEFIANEVLSPNKDDARPIIKSKIVNKDLSVTEKPCRDAFQILMQRKLIKL